MYGVWAALPSRLHTGTTFNLTLELPGFSTRAAGRVTLRTVTHAYRGPLAFLSGGSSRSQA